MGRAATRKRVERQLAERLRLRQELRASQRRFGVYQFSPGDLAVMKDPWDGIGEILEILQNEPTWKIYKVRINGVELVVGDTSVRPCYPTFRTIQKKKAPKSLCLFQLQFESVGLNDT